MIGVTTWISQPTPPPHSSPWEARATKADPRENQRVRPVAPRFEPVDR